MPINLDFKIQNIMHKRHIPGAFLLKTSWNIIIRLWDWAT